MVDADYLAMIRGAPSMNHLVRLEAEAGELESILRGVKTMLVRELDPARPGASPVTPGDSLNFLRDTDDGAVRVKATVTSVLLLTSSAGDDLSRSLKEMQPKLQLTETQFDYWSGKRQALLIEFDSAQKIEGFHVASRSIPDPSGWIAFEQLRDIADQEAPPQCDAHIPESSE